MDWRFYFWLLIWFCFFFHWTIKTKKNKIVENSWQNCWVLFNCLVYETYWYITLIISCFIEQNWYITFIFSWGFALSVVNMAAPQYSGRKKSGWMTSTILHNLPVHPSYTMHFHPQNYFEIFIGASTINTLNWVIVLLALLIISHVNSCDSICIFIILQKVR